MNDSLRHFIGLDLSLTATGVVDYCPLTGAVRAETFGTKPKPGVSGRMYRYGNLIGMLNGWLPHFDSVDTLCVEGYSYGSKGRGVFDIAEMGGLVRHWLITEHQVRVIEVPPSTVKLFVTGKGGGKGTDKVGVAVALAKRYGVQFANDNEYDAFALAKIAACIGEAEEPQTEFQRRALEKL